MNHKPWVVQRLRDSGRYAGCRWAMGDSWWFHLIWFWMDGRLGWVGKPLLKETNPCTVIHTFVHLLQVLCSHMPLLEATCMPSSLCKVVVQHANDDPSRLDDLGILILCNVAFTKESSWMTSDRCWILKIYGPTQLLFFLSQSCNQRRSMASALAANAKGIWFEFLKFFWCSIDFKSWTLACLLLCCPWSSYHAGQVTHVGGKTFLFREHWHFYCYSFRVWVTGSQQVEVWSRQKI